MSENFHFKTLSSSPPIKYEKSKSHREMWKEFLFIFPMIWLAFVPDVRFIFLDSRALLLFFHFKLTTDDDEATTSLNPDVILRWSFVSPWKNFSKCEKSAVYVSTFQSANNNLTYMRGSLENLSREFIIFPSNSSPYGSTLIKSREFK